MSAKKVGKTRFVVVAHNKAETCKQCYSIHFFPVRSSRTEYLLKSSTGFAGLPYHTESCNNPAYERSCA